MENFRGYFKKEKRVFLENVSYETVRPEDATVPTRRLGCRDTVVAQLLMPVGVKIIFNRRLNFEPEALFTLSVSFGTMLLFNPEKRDEVAWKDVNLVNECTAAYPEVIAEMASRTTLLVSEITSAAGGIPLITQVPLKKDEKKSESEDN